MVDEYMTPVELGERFGNLEAITQLGIEQRAEMMQDLREIKQDFSEFRKDFALHVADDARVAVHIENIQKTLAAMAPAVKTLEQQRNTAVITARAFKWLFLFIASAFMWALGALDHVKHILNINQ